MVFFKVEISAYMKGNRLKAKYREDTLQNLRGGHSKNKMGQAGISPVLSTACLPSKHRPKIKILLHVYRALNGMSPPYLVSWNGAQGLRSLCKNLLEVLIQYIIC